MSSGKWIVALCCFTGTLPDTTRPQGIQDLWNIHTFEYLNKIPRYPESWPQQQIVVGQALRRYGLSEPARKISQRYIANVVATWEKIGSHGSGTTEFSEVTACRLNATQQNCCTDFLRHQQLSWDKSRSDGKRLHDRLGYAGVE